MRDRVLDGRYQLIDRLGSEAGAAWLAFDRVLRCDVIARVLPISLEHGGREAFERRAASVAALGHPGIARLRAFGVDGDTTPYIICERVHGEDLAARLARVRQAPPRAVAAWMELCARALQAAHAQGIAHGAVRADHVILTRGELGVAAHLVGFSMAPGDVHPRDDLRALSALGLRAITGGDDLDAVTGDESVDGFFAKALGRDGGDGFASAVELLDALHGAGFSGVERRTHKVLVVDDEADVELLIRQRFRRQIRRGEYEFLFASNGADALAKLAANEDTDAVLSDINMPEMDGLTFLSRAREMLAYLKVVMVSAYGDLGNIRAAMNRGAFDFVTKPIDFGDLEATLQKAVREVTVVREALRNQAEAERARSNLARYFPPNLVDLLSGGAMPFGAGQRIHATALFVDMVSFTTMAEAMEPEEVLSLLREFHGYMEAEVFRYGGTLEKYIGDAMLAVWGMPAPGARDATNAVSCAHGMLSAVEGWNRARAARSLAPVRVGIGLHHGPVVVGDIGRDRNVAVVVLGDTINVASRLQSLTRDLGVPLVVAQEVVDAVRAEVGPDADAVLRGLVEHGEVSLRGRSTTLRVSKLAPAPRAEA